MISQTLEMKSVPIIDNEDNKSTIDINNFLKILLIIILIIIFLLDINAIRYNRKKGEDNLLRFYKIIPSFIRSNRNGFFETNRNGLEQIPFNKINYKKEDSCFIQKVESIQMSNVAGNIDSSYLLDIAIIHSDANFKYQTDKLIKRETQYFSFVVKYINGYISINSEDIKFKDSFIKKIEEISNER